MIEIKKKKDIRRTTLEKEKKFKEKENKIIFNDFQNFFFLFLIICILGFKKCCFNDNY